MMILISQRPHPHSSALKSSVQLNVGKKVGNLTKNWDVQFPEFSWFVKKKLILLYYFDEDMIFSQKW